MSRLAISIFIVLLATQLVSSQKYLFSFASISVTNVKGGKDQDIIYTQTTAIDQHSFANAVDMKIKTKRMKMYEGAVKNLPYLKILRVKMCGIETLEAKAFKNLPSLEVLHMQDNDLRAIVNGVFNHLPIKELWLHRNRITTIQSSAFDNMLQLEVIKLNKNSLTKWDSRWFANTPKLTQLFFRRNKITELPKKAFVNLQTSHKINGEEFVDMRILLSQNLISKIHPEALDGIDSLDELNLRRNQLVEIDWKVFSHMTELHTLNLKLNNLAKIDADAFEKIGEIVELDLSKNYFECFPYEIIAKSKKVNLSGNYNVQCDCLRNLKEKLKEEKVDNEVIARDMSCDFNGKTPK